MAESRPGPDPGELKSAGGGSPSARRPSAGGSSTRGASSAHRPAPRKRRRRAGVTAASAALYVVAVIGVSLILATLAWIWAGDVLALNKPYREATVVLPEEVFTQREVTVSTTDSQGQPLEHTEVVYKAKVGKVADILKENGIIEYKTVFRLFSAVTHGADKMVPGTYELNTDMDYRAIISSISAGSASRTEISVTIPEGYSMDQLFALLEEEGVASVADLTEMAANHDYQFSFLSGIPLGDAHRLEGYLFPDTYRFYIGEDPLYVLNKMLVNFDTMVSEDTRAELAEAGKDLREVLTVASLIEKETDGEDQAMIASVIYNRLNHPDVTGGYLQIDATLAYLNGGKVPTEADKAIDSPYNTYRYKGLPPGPICNPGSTAIWAAMNPMDTDYYYYALGSDGVHHYSRTYQEHQNFLASLSKN